MCSFLFACGKFAAHRMNSLVCFAPRQVMTPRKMPTVYNTDGVIIPGKKNIEEINPGQKDFVKKILVYQRKLWLKI